MSIICKGSRFFGLFSFIVLFTPGLFALEASKKTWRDEMRELSALLQDISPDIFSDAKKTNIKSLKAKTKKILTASQELDATANHGTKTPDFDPTLPFLSGMFREDIGRAYRSLESGNVAYAKDVLRSSISYCIACHTRSDQGPQFPLLSSFSQKLSEAPWVERISFQAATRQFDPVFNEVIQKLQGGDKANLKLIDLEKGIQIALSIAVRVKHSPEQAMTLAKAVLNSPLITEFMKKNATQWVADIQIWQKEDKRTYKKDSDYLAHATDLVGSPDTQRDSSFTPGTEIKYLRASMLMHEMLGKYPNSTFAAEALYLTGLSYDVLQDLGVWSIHEMYYRACIEKKPHSPLAGRCYARYKESVILGYTGSAGTFVPPVVRVHLNQLQRMSEVTTPAAEAK